MQLGNLSFDWLLVQAQRLHNVATQSTKQRDNDPKNPSCKSKIRVKTYFSSEALKKGLRKCLSELCTSTGSSLVPTYLAFQHKLRPYSLICLPNNWNNYPASLLPVLPRFCHGWAFMDLRRAILRNAIWVELGFRHIWWTCVWQRAKKKKKRARKH